MINVNVLNNAQTLRKIFFSANPYPHVVIDNFLLPEILNTALEEITKIQDKDWAFDPEIPQFQSNKFYLPTSASFENSQRDLDFLKINAPISYDILHYLYSDEVKNFISNLTEIENLEGDNSWFGAGIHKIVRDGRLAIHSDFNINWKINKYRRVNLLLYLNKNWKEEYKGDLELWNRDMSSCAKKVSPLFNRAIIFTTDKTSYHGHTEPLNAPEGTSRYSFALYYYNDTPPPLDDVEQRFVSWQTTI